MGPAGLGPAGVPRFVLAQKPGAVLAILSGALALTETGDTLAATAAVLVGGTLTANQADQTLVAAGGATVAGNLAATEQPDTLAATARALVAGVLGLTEANDTIAASGGPVVAGALGLTEAPDTLSAAGTVSGGAVTGTLGLVQASNTIDAEVYAGGELAAAGGGGVVHAFTRKRWRELASLIAAERAARAKAEQLPSRAARVPLLQVAEAAAEAIDVARIEGENARLDALLVRNVRIIRQALHAATQAQFRKQAAAAIAASRKIVDRQEPAQRDDDDDVELMLHLNNLH